MRVRRANLGQAQSSQVGNCGANPCTWLDEIWASDDCVAYMQCAQPTSVIATGSIVTSAIAQTGAAVGQGISQGTTGFFSSQTPLSIGVLIVAGLVIAAIAVHQL